MGQRLETRVNQNPGPATYDVNDKMTKASAGHAIIGHSERQEHWVDKNGAEMPGPGNYVDKSTFGEKDKGPTIAYKIEEKVRQGPGPG